MTIRTPRTNREEAARELYRVLKTLDHRFPIHPDGWQVDSIRFAQAVLAGKIEMDAEFIEEDETDE